MVGLLELGNRVVLSTGSDASTPARSPLYHVADTPDRSYAAPERTLRSDAL